MEKVVFREAMEGMEADQVIRDHEYSMTARHFHDTYELYYLVEGERYYFIDKETYPVKRGDVVLVKKSQIHKTSMAGNSYHNRFLLQIRSEVFDPVLQAGGLSSMEEFYDRNGPIISLGAEEQRTVEHLLLTMKEEMKRKQKNGTLMVRLKLMELFIVLSRSRRAQVFSDEGQRLRTVQTVQTAKHQKVHEVADYLLNHPETGESLEELAGRFYISKSYLSRIFKEVTGFTVNEYLNITRVKKAQILLACSERSVTEISGLLGFESITYFERIFKKYTDSTPLKYRKAQKN